MYLEQQISSMSVCICVCICVDVLLLLWVDDKAITTQCNSNMFLSVIVNNCYNVSESALWDNYKCSYSFFVYLQVSQKLKEQ